MAGPLRLAFIGCGFITGVHSRHLKALGADVVAAYASRDRARAEQYCQRYAGARSYGDYTAAIDDPAIDAVVIAVPPKFHLDLTLQALAAGKHVLVEKPAFLRMADYETVRAARTAAGRVVLVGENDHYKPLAVTLRRLLAEGVIGEMVFAHFTTLVHRLKTAEDWRNDESMAGGDAFFEEGDPLAAPGRQPRAHHCHRARVSPAGSGHRPRSTGQEPDGRLSVRQPGGRIALLLARSAVAAARAAPVEALRARGHHHVRKQRRLRAGARQRLAARDRCRACATSGGTRRCIAISPPRSATAALPR